ncbi:glucose-6-phosphatase 2-like isoform X4 [Biomphalaria glabrata]|uniref:glucose-6-phosphatase n=1 Tax=Biomphalaria glabrata TaxID=6526 RepID=A0A9W3BPQ2_BIOGL|nr:glucose-6-phosphatase 2-like isoform X4 [Biomphalaria glabrata]
MVASWRAAILVGPYFRFLQTRTCPTPATVQYYLRDWTREKIDLTTYQGVICVTVCTVIESGSPSGHAMVTSAVWYVLVSDFLYYQQIQSFGLKILCWATYVIMMCAVCLSRLFIATHFPHQVSAGIIIGILLGMVMNSLATSALQLPFYLLTSFLLAFIATMTYLLLNLVGIDPFWSLASATKWCAFQEWVHLDKTLFYCIVRDISCLLGLGLAVFCCQFKKLTCRSQKTIILQVLVAVLMLHAGDRLKLNIHNIVLFYVEAFFKHLFLTFVVAAGIPVVFSLF